MVREPGGESVLVNREEPPWRRNFSIAHEVFHLITWDYFRPDLLRQDDALRIQAEKFADAFASHLLLPAESLIDALRTNSEGGAVSFLSLVSIARRFGVSTSALLYRLTGMRLLSRTQTQSLLDSEEFRAIDKSTMHAAWSEAPEIPERFVKLAFVAYKLGRMSRMRLAGILDVSLLGLDAKLAQYGFNESAIYDTMISVGSDPADDNGSTGTPATS
jgi:Zn-dependent peptidase ImmA (M78 family)